MSFVSVVLVGRAEPDCAYTRLVVEGCNTATATNVIAVTVPKIM